MRTLSTGKTSRMEWKRSLGHTRTLRHMQLQQVPPSPAVPLFCVAKLRFPKKSPIFRKPCSAGIFTPHCQYSPSYDGPLAAAAAAGRESARLSQNGDSGHSSMRHTAALGGTKNPSLRPSQGRKLHEIHRPPDGPASGQRFYLLFCTGGQIF